MRRLAWSCATVCCLISSTAVLSAAESAPAVDFSREIRPLLSRSCYACHGPDEAERKASLRLDLRDAALTKLESGAAALVPGKRDDSELFLRITAEDDQSVMPPRDSGHELSKDQIELIGRWIDEGAEYRPHWAYVKPARSALPSVKQTDWAKNGLDRFILARLEAAGLEPSPEASRYALIRRLSLDLRGLPPTPEEVAAFINDTRPNAYEQLVEAFLADPAYGERWARMWLDQARYADSMGYGSDPLRMTIWRYRDWVIDAFNRNLPYDQFTIEQIAGDLLPNATPEQQLATAFHRNTMTNTEGGTDDEEFRTLAVKDRIDTTMQVWMGLTFGCAKCHTHKFEPITHAEYYQFFALFNQTADADRGDESPLLASYSPEILDELKQVETELAALKSKTETATPELAVAQAEWEASLAPRGAWTPLVPEQIVADSQAPVEKAEDGTILVTAAGPPTESYTVTAVSDLRGATAFRLETFPDDRLPGRGAGRAGDGNFVLSRFSVTAEPVEANKPIAGRFVRVELPGEAKWLALAEVQVFQAGENIARTGKATQSTTDYDAPPQLAIDGNTDGDFFKARSTTHTAQQTDPWWEIDLGEAKAIDSIKIWNRSDGEVGPRLTGYRVFVLDAERKTVWQQSPDLPKPSLELTPTGRRTIALTRAFADHSQPNFPVADALQGKDPKVNGWAVGPEIQKPHAAVFAADSAIAGEGAVRFTIRLEHRFNQPGYALGKFRLSVTNDQQVLQRSAVPVPMLAIIDTPADKRTPEQQTQLATYYRTIAPALEPVRTKIAELEKSKPQAPMVPVMQELPEAQHRKTFVMLKGNFLTTGAEVQAEFPSAFHRPAEDLPRSRAGVARWLVSPENPLTARVAVNRYWAQLFGVGLVPTEEDFGTQGELPSHPELLDWLAVEFMTPEADPAAAWDMKRLLRLIVTSATYRQSSQVTPDRLAQDPQNRLVSRGPRFRLEAEMVRDQALRLSGLLSKKMHGPSVYPPQPPGLWQAAFNGQRTWATSEGEDKYRRGLYTFWRRTIPYPSMATFDAPSREVCASRRIRTNTPLQSLVTLNDPVYVEAAQALARRIVKEGGKTTEERAKFGLQLCLTRPATEAEVAAVLELVASETAHYAQNKTAAEQIATEPLGPLPAGMDPAELAAWTVVANILLNLDGVLMKG